MLKDVPQSQHVFTNFKGGANRIYLSEFTGAICSIFRKHGYIRRASWPAMFKKLKQKIEEGGESGIEKVAFSPRKLPGVVVRSPSQSEQPPPSQNVESTPPSLNKDLEEPDISSGSRDEDQGVTIEVAPSIRGQGQVSYETCLNMTQSHV